MYFYMRNDDFIYCWKKLFKPTWTCVKSDCPPKPNSWLCHSWQQQLKSSVCSKWQ